MDKTIIDLGTPVQALGLAIIVLMVVIMGIRIAAHGSKGFALVIGEMVGVLVGLWFVARPNDLLGLLLKAVGGIQAPGALH